MRADLLGRVALFIGYSLSDVSNRHLLYKLERLWEASSFNALRPKSYIFLRAANPVQERVLHARGIEPIISGSEDPGEGLFQFLSELLEEVKRK